MRFDITPYIDMSPAEVRQRIRKGEITFPTAGMCRGYAQANLVILPPEYAADFEEYTRLYAAPPAHFVLYVKNSLSSSTRKIF